MTSTLIVAGIKHHTHADLSPYEIREYLDSLKAGPGQLWRYGRQVSFDQHDPVGTVGDQYLFFSTDPDAPKTAILVIDKVEELVLTSIGPRGIMSLTEGKNLVGGSIWLYGSPIDTEDESPLQEGGRYMYCGFKILRG